MSSLHFAHAELAAAIARGVRQCVLIGARSPLRNAVRADHGLEVFSVDEAQPVDTGSNFVPTQFDSETLAGALEKSHFDRLKASMFVWVGGAGYRTIDAAIASLAFIASLPKGSGVVLDYAVERTSLVRKTYTALDALASRMRGAGGSVRYLIQPQAVAAMLRDLGFQQITDLEQSASMTGGHLVSALV